MSIKKEYKKMKHEIGYRYRIKNISYEDARKRVFDKLGYVKTKIGVSMIWTKKTESINFLDEEENIVAIYNKTLKNFWWCGNKK